MFVTGCGNSSSNIGPGPVDFVLGERAIFCVRPNTVRVRKFGAGGCDWELAGPSGVGPGTREVGLRTKSIACLPHHRDQRRRKMSSPDTNLKKQKRRHRGPLIGMAVVAVFAIGLILFWIGEVFVTAPGPESEPAEAASEQVSPTELETGTVDVPPEAPVEEVAPGDTDVEVEQ
jgi:hypothetical protein